MENTNMIARKVVSARVVVNGSNVTMNFAPVSNDRILENAKSILAASFSQSMLRDGQHLENRILMQP